MLKAHRIPPTEIDGLEIVPAHPQREWMNKTPMPQRHDHSAPVEPTVKQDQFGFANRCLPMLMANQIGWNVVTKVPYVITALSQGNHVTYFPLRRPPRFGGPVNNFANGIVTWQVPWVMETPPGWDLLVIPPPNKYLPSGVTCLSGLVETDHSPATFTVNWHLEPLTAVHLEPGDVIATLIPFHTDEADGWGFEEDLVPPAGYEEWQAKRAESNNHQSENFGRWDKDYWNNAKRRKIKRPKDTNKEHRGESDATAAEPDGRGRGGQRGGDEEAGDAGACPADTADRPDPVGP